MAPAHHLPTSSLPSDMVKLFNLINYTVYFHSDSNHQQCRIVLQLNCWAWSEEFQWFKEVRDSWCRMMDVCDCYQINKFNTLAGKSFSCIFAPILDSSLMANLMRFLEVVSARVKCKDPVSICIPLNPWINILQTCDPPPNLDNVTDRGQ